MARCAKGISGRINMKVLFIEPYPIEGPSSRYRVEQYIPYLRSKGILCIVRPFISSKFYKILYKRGYYIRKGLFFLQSSAKRALDLFVGLDCDIIFIHLEAFPFGPPLLEWFFKKIGKKIIYDLDDAIYLGNTSTYNILLRRFKCPSKITQIIQMCDHVITCNEYLAVFASKFNPNVTVIHTSVDTDKFIPKDKNAGNLDSNQDITIGWVGSHSTAPYLEELKGIFYKLSLKHKFKLKTIGAREYNLKIPGIVILNLDWRLEDEISQFQSLDIGVYPLPNEEWVYGKTGFKTIQYMSVGIPCVASNIGSNNYIIDDGVNGYLAKTDEEWLEKLTELINDAGVRERMGLAGRKTVVDKFSLKVNAPKIFELIEKVHSI